MINKAGLKSLLVILTFIKLANAEIWYLSKNGSSTDCGRTIETPCNSLHYIVKQSDSNDTIRILAAYQYEEFQMSTGPIEINHSLDVVGHRFRPKLVCDQMTAFQLSGNVTSVRFRNILFTREKRTEYCELPSKGFIHVNNAHVTIERCYFWKLCSAITLEFDEEDLTFNVLINATIFQRTSFVISADKLENANLNVLKSTFIGTTRKDITSYAISIQSDGFLQLTVEQCYLRKFHQGISLTFKYGVHDVLVNSTYFTHIEGQVIIAKFAQEIDEENSKFHVYNTTFVSNRGLFSSALHLLVINVDRVRVITRIDRSMFVDNEGRALFGTIYANGITLLISNCYFGNNVAGEYHSTIQGFGGAVYVETDTIVEAVNTTFRNNSCTGFGGAIFSRGSFRCFNCSFYSIESNHVKPLLGDILYATSNLTLINTTWISLTADDGRNRPLIWHPGSPTVENWQILVSGSFDAHCPDGHNISESGVIRDKYDFTKRLTLRCKSCPRNQYSLNSGYLKVDQEHGNVSLNKERIALCYPCRYGGICDHGSIRPQANYYGYRIGEEDSNEVRFMSCPSGYCCKGKECKKYNSCHKNRTGFLCGKCKHNLGENLINANCIAPEKCDDIWILPFYMICGIFYIIAFMYLDYIGSFIKSQLVWWEKRIPFHDDLEDYEKLDEDGTVEQIPNRNVKFDQYGIGGEEISDRDEPDSLADILAPTLQIFESLRTKKEPDMFTDFVSLSFYFFQMFLLIRMRESIVLEYLVTQLRSIYSSLFTLSIEAHSNPFVLCPIPNLTSISKLLLIKSFSFYILGLLFTFHGLVYIIQLKDDWSENQRVIEFSIRLKVATIRIIQLAYATLTTTAMTMVSCVNINTRFVLIIDGSVQCYTWWQGGIFFIVIGWVLPFPITLMQSLVDLKKNVITYHQFVLAWIFPFPYLCWSVVAWYRRRKRRRNRERSDTVDGGGDATEEEELMSEMDQSVKEILFRMESPYKGKANHLSTEERQTYKGMQIPEPAFWSGVLIGRRLILILVFSFVQAPVLRLYLALIICIVYLVHHMYYQPYLNDASNIVEVISSSTLIVFCSMNLFFAYSYVSDITPEKADKMLTVLFRWFEAVILVFLPTLVILVLSGLVLTRVFVCVGHCVRFLCSRYPTRIDR